DDILSEEVAAQRFNAGALAGFAAVAAPLGGGGIYGGMAHVLGQRTREIGGGVAMGARAGDRAGVVLKQGLRLALIGVVLGVGASLALTRMMSSMLFGVKASDPATYIGVAVGLTVVALAACWIPAQRATRVDPVIALRYE